VFPEAVNPSPAISTVMTCPVASEPESGVSLISRSLPTTAAVVVPDLVLAVVERVDFVAGDRTESGLASVAAAMLSAFGEAESVTAAPLVRREQPTDTTSVAPATATVNEDLSFDVK